MMTRSIVGRFLILAVLLVSLGVIAQAALIISKGSVKAVAKADPPAAARPVVASAAPVPAPPAAAEPATAAAPAVVAAAPIPQAAPAADAAPVRVVYPGPIGDGSSQPRKFAAAAAPAPAVPPAAPSPAPQPAAAPQAAMAPPPAPAPAPPAPAPAPANPAPAKAAPVVVASAGTQPDANPPAASRGGVNLNNASVDALNHLGGGHIGESIVKHRPYGSVEDLVKKRVVRRSVYEQIKNQVAAQ